MGRIYYPDASSILLLCDAGGSNNCRHYIFKQELQRLVKRLVDEIGVEIRVAHYPTYCSKFNPIERRFFCHVTQACQGVLFETLDKVVNLMRKTATQTGLSTTVAEAEHQRARSATGVLAAVLSESDPEKPVDLERTRRVLAEASAAIEREFEGDQETLAKLKKVIEETQARLSEDSKSD